MHDLEARELGRRDERVVRKVRGDRVGVAVVAHFFEQGLGGSLGNATVDLALEQQRVQHGPGIVAGHVTKVAHLTRLGVDLDDSDVGAEREGGARRLEVRRRLQPVLQVAIGLGGNRQFGPRLGDSWCAGDVERRSVLVEHDVGLVGLEHLGGQLAGRVDELARSGPHRGAALLQ